MVTDITEAVTGRSLRGNVDRNDAYHQRDAQRICRSLRGNVDRNTDFVMQILSNIDCRSLRGNVDRNNYRYESA